MFRLRKWDDLPEFMKVEEVKPYYDILSHKKISLFFKRIFDISVSAVALILLSPFFLILALAIKIDSKGPVFYRQIRITQYGKEFRIHKFRSMCDGADKKGSLVTVNGDTRITKVGKFIRKYKLDELSQLIDVFQGAMSFVGTRPEVPKYVKVYTPEMLATLLLPAGITSEASIKYKDENTLLDKAEDVDNVYIEKILLEKMKYNLNSISRFSFFVEITIILKTVFLIYQKRNQRDA